MDHAGKAQEVVAKGRRAARIAGSLAVRGLIKGLVAVLGISAGSALLLILGVIILVLGIFGAMPQTVAEEKDLKSRYEGVAQSYVVPQESVDGAEKEHQLSWGLLYAVDLFANQGKEFTAKKTAPILKSSFEYEKAEVIERKVIKKDNGPEKVIEQKKSIKLLKKVVTYRGIYEYRYEDKDDGTTIGPVLAGITFTENLEPLRKAYLAAGGKANTNDPNNGWAMMIIRAGEAFASGAPSLDWLGGENEVWSAAAAKWNWESTYDGDGLKGFVWPLEGPITSPFGERIHPLYGYRSFHTGVDIGAPYGSPIKSAGQGLVRAAGWVRGYGLTVVVDHGKGWMTLYAHCSSLLAHEGQEVKAGDVIAREGSTGLSTGPHLHFEVRDNGKAVDPVQYRAALGR